MVDTVRIRESFTVLQDPQTLYEFWKRLSNLPSFLPKVRAVETFDDTRSRWNIEGPNDRHYVWDAETVVDDPGRSIAWATAAGSGARHRGAIEFRPATGNRGTVVTAAVEYTPPPLEGLGAKPLGGDPEQLVREGLRRFKQLVETGEIPTVEGQPSGRDEGRKRRRAARPRGEVAR